MNTPVMLAGPTGSRKTYWITKLLKNEMFTEHVSSVLYCYGVYQTYYDQIKIPNLEFHKGLPSLEKVQSLNDGKFHVIVLDDLMEYIVKVLKHKIYLQSIVIIITLQQFFDSKWFCTRSLFQNYKY